MPPGKTPCEWAYPGAIGCYDGDVWVVSYKDTKTGEIIVPVDVLGHEVLHWLKYKSRNKVRDPHDF